MGFLDENYPIILDVAITLALVAGLLYLGFRNRPTRVFALYMFLTALVGIGNLMLAATDNPAQEALWLRLRPYAYLPFPFLLAYFAALWPHRRAWLPRDPWAVVPFVAGVVALEALYVLDHRAVTSLSHPLGFALATAQLLPPLLALVFARDYFAMPAERRRPELLWVSLGFMLPGLFWWSRIFHGHVTGRLAPADLHVSGGMMLLDGVLLAYLAHRGWRSREPEVRHGTRRFIAVSLLALGIAQVLFVLPRTPLVVETGRLTLMAAGLALPLLVGYGVAKGQMFGLDRRVRRTVQQSTLAATFLGVYVVASQAATTFLAPSYGPYVGVAGAMVLVFALVPLQRFAERVGTAVVPGGGGGGAPADLEKLRAMDAYRAALEEALAEGGTLTDREAAMLARLRGRLGLTERDHALLEQAVRSGGGLERGVSPGSLVLGRYRVRRLLGEGSFGRTFLAEDTVLRREVVIKALRPERARDPALLREARTIGAIRHPHVVTLYDVERVGDEAYIVMEHAEGGSLAQRLGSRGALGPGEFARVGVGVLAALEAVHGAGTVHRDVKPSNVLLTAAGEAKLADFGVAQVPGAETTAVGLRGGEGGVGTVRYMSPEVAKGYAATPRSDLYSAAVTLLEAWTGEARFRERPGESAVELQFRVASTRGFDTTRFLGPAALARWFERALEPDPGRRFADAAEMRVALEAAMGEASSSASAPPRGAAPPRGVARHLN